MANPFKKPKRRYNLSKIGRAALRANAMKTRPWKHSTGPRTVEGKLMTSQNNLKHGYYCRVPVLAETRAYRAFARSRQCRSTKPKSPPIGPPILDD